MKCVAAGMIACILLGAVHGVKAAEAPASISAPMRIIPPEQMKHYIDEFNGIAPEKTVNLIPDDKVWAWMNEEVPFFDCPNETIREIYYFRWWSYRKHIKKLDFICLTEFLPWKNPVSSAVGHHVMEGRWLHNPEYIDQDILYWMRGPSGGKPYEQHKYSSWTVWAAYQRYLVNHDRDFIVGMLDDFMRDYKGWEAEHLVPAGQPGAGTYWQLETRDAMEDSINGDRKAVLRRPSISSYMYGNAMAIAAIARLAGKPQVASEYEGKAAKIKDAVQKHLWDPAGAFFKCMFADGHLSGAREEIGFIPWYFELPDKGYEAAWKQFTDPQGFSAPFGITTAERRAPGFRTHGSGHSCEWDGAVWPFATAQTLTALANVLNDYPQSDVTKNDYCAALETYAKSQHMNGKPYIGEYLDEKDGHWLHIKDLERGRDYNHSTFCDLVISGLVGIHPRDDSTVEVRPLVPTAGPNAWDYFCVDNVLYHGKSLSIVWDKTGQHYQKGAGLAIFENGREIARRGDLGSLTGTLE